MAYYDDGTFRKRYLKVFESKGEKRRGGLSVAVETPDGQLLYNFIPTDPNGINRNRLGALLYTKGKGPSEGKVQGHASGDALVQAGKTIGPRSSPPT